MNDVETNPVPSVLMECIEGVATIAFNRPSRRNALDMETRERFRDLVFEAVRDTHVRAIVLTGKGGHFCSGGDLSAMKSGDLMQASEGRQRMRAGLEVVEKLYQCDKPVIAAVEGCAFGGGFGLALLADMVIASETARFCLSFSKIGLVPDCASLYTLPRIVGVQRAKHMMFSACEIDAQCALSWGIAIEVVSAGDALRRGQEIARALATTSASAMSMAKVGLNQSLSSGLAMMMEYEATAQGVAFSTPYHQEATRRLLAKESPIFRWPASESLL